LRWVRPLYAPEMLGYLGAASHGRTASPVMEATVGGVQGRQGVGVGSDGGDVRLDRCAGPRGSRSGSIARHGLAALVVRLPDTHVGAGE
jgi:hypothetical protein